MDFRIASAMNKMRFTPKQAVNLNVNPNSRIIVSRTERTVKVQALRAKSHLRKAFKQKPDEFVSVQITETAPKKAKKLPKHKRKHHVVTPKKQVAHKTMLLPENEPQEILSSQLSKEEEREWIDIALRNHNNSWDYKIPSEHYKSEIEINNLEQISRAKIAEDAYAKATEAKTKAYFDEIVADEKYNDRLYWRELVTPHIKKSVIVNVNNRLLSL